MALNIENTSGAPLNINDLGITLAIGQIVDLSLIGDPFGVANSANGGDLDALITAPSISVKDPIDGTTALSVADGLAACRAMNETHWRVGTGARIGDISDVDVSGVADGEVLTYQTGSGNWEALPAPGDVDRTQIVYVGKHGSDANSGLRPTIPKLTIGAAITTASGLSPTTSNRITVKVLDGGTYTESFTVPSWVTLEAFGATLEGTVTLSDDSEVIAREIVKTTSGIAVSKPAGTGSAYASADVIRADGTADAVVNGAVTSVMIVHARQVFVEDGTAILDNSTGPGHIHLDVEDLYVSGTGTAIDRASNTGAIQGRVSHILDIGAGTGTGIDITTGNVNLNVGTIDITTAWNVAGAGTLSMFVNQIVSGTKTQTSGAATVNDAGKIGCFGCRKSPR